MLVRMLINITGARNAEPWPAMGETLDVPDHEGADLIAQGYAVDAKAPVADEPDDEGSTVRAESTKSTGTRKAPARKS